ncbi:TIGR04282 family arsenosugar biosynthesis glycosyltransferase [Gracilimonas sp. Q87]|uniref:TIGR04282 family arsenosugar biosynthesis glycosyltransferase n=1 Tax=Gracilimonas sp. Q87 TaxID=3384766 RepID=UPI0039840487
MTKEKLIIFVKNEEAGKVKSRLAKSIGNIEALRVYQKLLRYTYSETVSLKMNKEIWYSSYVELNDIWENDRFTKKLQKGDDLGQRMEYAFKTAFENGAEKAVIIGSDNAEITAKIIEDAFLSLNKKEFVIGPAKDGGYYLLGMNKFYPKVFKKVKWSTEEVFESTIGTIEQLGESIALLKTLNDVDIIEDWIEAKGILLNTPEDHV